MYLQELEISEMGAEGKERFTYLPIMLPGLRIANTLLQHLDQLQATLVSQWGVWSLVSRQVVILLSTTLVLSTQFKNNTRFQGWETCEEHEQVVGAHRIRSRRVHTKLVDDEVLD